MMNIQGLVLLVILSVSLHNVLARDPGKQFAAKYAKLIDRVKTNATVRERFRENAKLFNLPPPKPNYVEFNCIPEKSPTRPTSAHKIRPADINVVAAVGDSITAAFAAAATDVLDIVREDRGESWSIGANKNLESEVTTLPNILKKFNAALEGASFGEADVDDPGARLNVAISGNEAQDMPANVQKLTERMMNDNGVNWEEDWKMITFLIGGNDLCQYCTDEEQYSPANFIGHIQLALNHLHANVPRAIVNLNTMFDITQLPAFSDGVVCDVVQDIVCECAANSQHHAKLKEALRQYNQKMYELIDSGKYDTREDFTVILQEHFRDSEPPKVPGTGEVDKSFWALDCFHPGRKAHYAFGTSLWNTLLERVGEKRTKCTWEIGGKLPCPTEENPYIFTRLNSQPATTAAPTVAHDAIQLIAEQSVQGPGKNHGQPTDASLPVALAAIGLATIAIAVVAVALVAAVKLQKRKTTKPAARPEDDSEAHENTLFDKQHI